MGLIRLVLLSCSFLMFWEVITCDVTVWRQYIACQTPLQSVKQILEVWNDQLRISIFGTFFGQISAIVHLPFENINVNFCPNVGCFNSLIAMDGQFRCQRQIYEVLGQIKISIILREKYMKVNTCSSSQSCHWQWNKENISSIQERVGPEV